MKTPLRILHLEDDRHDAALVQATLQDGEVACLINRVQSRDEFVAALERGGIDLVLSDYSLPSFDGLSALAIMRDRWPELPVILVSGTLGEEPAVDALISGATDYVLKGRLGRLAPAICRAMLEVEDRAERQRLGAQLIEAQKMEVVGHLASGVAHDFNNILGIIMGYNELITMKLDAASPLRKDTEEIRLAVEHAAGLTRQLLVFSRNQTVQPVVLNLNETVNGLNKMLRRLIHENIEMTIVPGSNTGRIMADSGYIGQVLMNLVVNARDAMPNGGNLIIATSNVTIEEGDAQAAPHVPPGGYVLLSVSDTGTGMTEEVKARLFEAFFTTKPVGKGTGLGLATCQTIVRQSGGCIGVSSEPGRGATFSIYFPRVEALPPAAASLKPAGTLPRGTETLLIVEDEPGVRYLACVILKAQGYEVLSASNGQEALRVARGHRGSVIRLVITDVIMPLMGGKVMAEWLTAGDPNLKILFTSGYTDEAFAPQGAAEPKVAFLSKPYTRATLACKVREMLDEETEGAPV